MSVEEVQDIED